MVEILLKIVATASALFVMLIAAAGVFALLGLGLYLIGVIILAFGQG